MDEGWTRWVLEQDGFDIIALRPADFRAPLADKVDVVILTEDGRLPVEGAVPAAAAPAAGRRLAADAAAAAPFGRSTRIASRPRTSIASSSSSARAAP